MSLPTPITGHGPASFPEGEAAPLPVPFTKFLATIGPASESEDVLTKLVDHGVTLFRLNFSHGTLDDQKRRLEIIRAFDEKTYVPLTVLGDLTGPKIRCKTCPDAGIMLHEGQEVILRYDLEECRDGETPILSASYENVVTETNPGHRVLINDGAIRMLAFDNRGDELHCRVTRGGLVTTRKGINLPDTDLSVPAVTDYDWQCVDFAVEHGIDYLALSFVRSAEDLRLLNGRLKQICTDEVCGTGLADKHADPAIPVIAKIETPQAVANIEQVLDECDGIMVARGDLGVELDLAEVPMVQKKLIAAAHEHGKPAIVATQMLESMIEKPTATRAEVSDVANAILDDADCLMLSGETAVGQHPVEAVETLRRTAWATERVIAKMPNVPKPPKQLRTQRQLIPALAHGAWHIAQDVGVKLVVMWSERGGGARYMSRNSFRVPIIAYTSNHKAVRRMNLLGGVFPVLTGEVPLHRSDFAEMIDRDIIRHGWAAKGDPIIALAGKPLDEPGSTNTMSVRFVGDLSQPEELQYVDHGAEGWAT
ncbi:MAG: pyruvate kinase [Planctomycetota bacterium]